MQFHPTNNAFEQLLNAVDIQEYEVSRNHLRGAVTYLSPYITHGFVGLPSIVTYLKKDKGLHPQHKLFAELGWREYYYHVWGHLRDGVLHDIRPPIPNIHYTTQLPADVLLASTGLAPIDLSIEQLYATGYLHNHARMWLACYLIHFRKIHWRVCADWMYGYLLDGDLASNHLSWQWVGSTFSQKPYLFNAENVAKFAPAEWHCAGTVLDQSYEALERIARSNQVLQTSSDSVHETQENTSKIPALLSQPPQELLKKFQIAMDLSPLNQLTTNNWQLIHPWNLTTQTHQNLKLGILHTPFHEAFPWSLQRWVFVLERMSQVCDAIVMGDFTELLPNFLHHHPAVRIDVQETHNPFYTEVVNQVASTNDVLIQPIERFLANPDTFCPSFSKFWQSVVKKEKFPKP